MNTINLNLVNAIMTIDDKYSKEKDTLLEMVVNKKQRKPANHSGVVQLDTNTNKEIARFATIKDANLAIGKPASASGISDAINGRVTTHMAYGYKWYHCDEFDSIEKG